MVDYNSEDQFFFFWNTGSVSYWLYLAAYLTGVKEHYSSGHPRHMIPCKPIATINYFSHFILFFWNVLQLDHFMYNWTFHLHYATSADPLLVNFFARYVLLCYRKEKRLDYMLGIYLFPTLHNTPTVKKYYFCVLFTALRFYIIIFTEWVRVWEIMDSLMCVYLFPT